MPGSGLRPRAHHASPGRQRERGAAAEEGTRGFKDPKRHSLKPNKWTSADLFVCLFYRQWWHYLLLTELKSCSWISAGKPKPCLLAGFHKLRHLPGIEWSFWKGAFRAQPASVILQLLLGWIQSSMLLLWDHHQCTVWRVPNGLKTAFLLLFHTETL